MFGDQTYFCEDNMKRIFFLGMTFKGMFTFSKSSTIAGSHFENFVCDKRIFGAKTVNCVCPFTVTVIWEEYDEPDPEIDEPLRYLSDLIGQQQARLIGNFCSQSGKPFTKNFTK